MNKIDLKISAMNISVSVFGSGYVGCVSAACLSNDGFRVVAVDPDDYKVDCLASGRSPIYEPGLDAMLGDAKENGMLGATRSCVEAIAETNVSFCCVGTPSLDDGTLNTSYVEQVSRDIGTALRDKDEFHIVVMRSTILPGTMENLVIPTLEKASGKIAGVDFGVAYYPEFLRESTAIADYYEPGAIVFGQYGDDERSIDVLKAIVAHINVEPHVIPLRSAEIVKYTNNCWHAVKISFANEIGNLCKASGIDSHVVMNVVCSDNRLNISPVYMRPGFAYGGSCLPKDLRALTALGRNLNIPTPVLDAARSANTVQINHAKKLVAATGKDRIGFIGITFKENTDDLRESPMVDLVETFLGKGKQLAIYDPQIKGPESNSRSYMHHISPLVKSSMKEVLEESDVIVVGNKYSELEDALNGTENPIVVIDLARAAELGSPKENIAYQGLCW